MSDAAKVAVLLCGYGEVEEYSEFADYNERALRLLASKFIKFPDFSIPWLAKVLGASDRREWGQQDRYRSPHNDIFEAQRAGIERALKAQYGDRVSVFKAFNFCEPHLPHQVLEQVKQAGFDRVLIYPLLVVDSVFTSGLALEQINKALGEDSGWIRGMRYLPSFFEREEYHQRMADHVRARQKDLQGSYAPSQIGVLLLVHGCPHDAKGYESGIRESEALYYSVRDRLIQHYPLVSIAWMNHDTPGQWTTPDVNLAAENMLGMGARALIFAPIGFVTENHETMLDVSYSIKKFQDRAECLHLDCLNEDPGFLQIAAHWVAPLISELLEEAQPQLDPAVSLLPPVATLPNRNLTLHERLPAAVAHGHSHGPGGHHHSHSHAGHHHHH